MRHPLPLALALMLPAAALGQDDPDAFPVVEAVPVEAVPLDAAPEPSEAVPLDAAPEPVEAVPVQAAPAPSEAPLALPAAAPEPSEAPLALPMAAPEAVPAPVEAPLQAVATPAPTAAAETRTPAGSPTADAAPRGRPMHAVPWSPLIERVERWGRRAGRAATDRYERLAHPARTAASAPPPPPPPVAQVPPFHAASIDEQAPLAIPAAPPRPDTRPDEAPEDDARKAGLFIAMDLGQTGLAGRPSRVTGGELGVHFGQVLQLGIAGSHVQGPGASALDVVGGRAGIVWVHEGPVHLRTDAFFGLGAPVGTPGAAPLVNVFEPRAALELPLQDWARIDVFVAYRHVPGFQPGSKDLSGPAAGVGLRLGWF